MPKGARAWANTPIPGLLPLGALHPLTRHRSAGPRPAVRSFILHGAFREMMSRFGIGWRRCLTQHVVTTRFSDARLSPVETEAPLGCFVIAMRSRIAPEGLPRRLISGNIALSAPPPVADWQRPSSNPLRKPKTTTPNTDADSATEAPGGAGIFDRQQRVAVASMPELSTDKTNVALR